MDFYGSIHEDEKRNQVVFPKVLEQFNTQLKPEIDELGLTSTDRKALQNGWSLIKRKQRHAALMIYVDLFTEHEDCYEKFRFRNKLNIQYAAVHQKSVLAFFQLVFEQVDNARFVKSLVKEVALKHRAVLVTGAQWRLYTAEAKRYFVKLLNTASSPTFVNALDKIMDFICTANDFEETGDS